jgi:hypothetical protein
LADHCHPQGLEPFDDHLVTNHRFLLKLCQSQLNAIELFHLRGDSSAGLRLTQAQDAPELLHRDIVVYQRSDL